MAMSVSVYSMHERKKGTFYRFFENLVKGEDEF